MRSKDFVFSYSYPEAIPAAFYATGICFLCEAGALIYFPFGKKSGRLFMPCKECGGRGLIPTSYVITAN